MRERKTSEQVKSEQAEKENQLDIAQRRFKLEGQSIRKTFDTEDGRRCLKLIMDRCKYQSPITAVAQDGVIHDNNLAHNAALQGLYLWLRKHVSTQTLTKVEIEGLDEDLKGNE